MKLTLQQKKIGVENQLLILLRTITNLNEGKNNFKLPETKTEEIRENEESFDWERLSSTLETVNNQLHSLRRQYGK